MDGLLYKLGARNALQKLGLSTKKDVDDQQGTPFPEKSPTINAEALARILQQEDDTPDYISPENAAHREQGRAVTWGQSAHIDENQATAGMMLPSNPRG